MTDSFSRTEFLKFHDFLAQKGLMNRATVIARKAASNKLLSILDEEEANNLENLDVDSLVQRYHYLNQGKIKPESLKVYRSRLISSLSEFKRYTADPVNYKPNVTPKLKRAGLKSNNNNQTNIPPEQNKDDLTKNGDEKQHKAITFPIPIRQDTIVKILDLPHDLTKLEAEKISNVIKALAQIEGT